MIKLTALLLVISMGFLKAQTTQVINNKAALFSESVSSSVNYIVMTDTLEGGSFYRYTGSLPQDSGVILCDAGGNKFRRIFDESYGVYPEWWGAKGDGITDDLNALNKAFNYLQKYPYYKGGTIILKDRTYRITDTWILGTKWVNEEDCFVGNLTTTAPSFNLINYIATLKKNPVKVIAPSGAAIYGDFTSSTLKAIVYYALYGDVRASDSKEKYIGEITNVGFYGKGSFINGKAELKPDNSNGYVYNTNQIGLLCLYNLQMKITNATFYGLKEGLVVNNSYFGKLSSPYFKLCQRGFYTIQSHGSLIDNPTAVYCKKSYEIRSGQMVINNINSEHSGIALHNTAGNNVINGAYIESLNNSSLEGQLIIGDTNTTGEVCDGLIINALTIAASNVGGGNANGIVLRNSARRVSINGGVFPSVYITRVNSLTELMLTSCVAQPPVWAYKRDADITVKDLTVRGTISSAGNITAPTATITGSLTTSGLTVTGNEYITGETKQAAPFVNTTAFIKSKSFSFSNPANISDYIIKLGKFSVADGTKINGTISILGNNSYASCGYIQINYSNTITGNAKISYTQMTDTKYLTIGFVKYTDSLGVICAGIRVSTNSTSAWPPYHFMFYGLLSDVTTFATISSSTVTGITPLLSVDSRYELNATKIVTPNLKSNVPGVKKSIMVDEYGNWSIQ